MNNYINELKPIAILFETLINNLINKDFKINQIINIQDKINLYSIIYRICTNNTELETCDIGPEFCYNFYQENLNKYCMELKKIINSSENILEDLKIYINNFKHVTAILYTIFSYLDRHYIKYNDLDNIKYELPNLIFIENIIIPNNNKIINYLVVKLNLSRNLNENIEILENTFSLIYEVIKFSETDSENFLKNHFNILFESSNLYYTNIKKKYIYKSFSSCNYLTNSKNLFDNEVSLLYKYYNLIVSDNFDNFTLKEKEFKEPLYQDIYKLLNNFVKIFLLDDYKLILNNTNDGIIDILVKEDYDKLNFIYLTFMFDEKIIDYISDLYILYFQEITKLILKDFIKLLDHYEKYKLIINKYFMEDVSILNQYNDNFSKMINGENINSKQFVEKLIINFFVNPDVSIELLKLINEKDIFFNFYIEKLKERLLSNNYNLELEFYVLSKLEKDFKNSYTHKIRNILKDIEYNKTFNTELKNNIFNTFNVDFNIDILTDGIWKYKYNEDFNDIIKSQEIEEYYILSNEYFNYKTNNAKKLKYLHDKGEIILNLNKNIEVKTVPIIGMILLLYNNYDQLTFNQIKTEMNLTDDILEICLNSIVNHKNPILKLEDNYYKYNEIENINIIHIKLLPQIVKKEVIKESDIDDFKKYRTEACIVLTMKYNKTMNHNDLVNLIEKKLEKWASDKELIEKCILNIIEKEYIETDSNNSKLYHYSI